MQEDEHLLTLLKYVEANPLRAKMVRRAQDWKWSSLGCSKKLADALLDRWPMRRPGNWAALVNAGLDEPQRARVQASLDRGRPLGDGVWTRETANRMGQGYTLNPRGRPPGNAKADANREK